MGRTIDLRLALLRLINMQHSKVKLQYEYEKGEVTKALAEKHRVVWSKELREETELAVQLVECLFKVGGGTAEVRSSNEKENMADKDFTSAEIMVATDALAKLAKK